MSALNWASTAHLLRCTGFGTTGPAVDAAAGLDPAALVAKLFAVDPATDPGVAATPVPAFEIVPLNENSLSDKARADRKKLIYSQLNELTNWWPARMLAVAEPISERLTFAWHAIFATSMRKVRLANLMLNQNVAIRRLHRGDFKALAVAMLVDPAMIFWLDNQANRKGAPNENLAREAMELFMLGHGDGYSENDVREAARALTGWTLDQPNGKSAFDPARFDSGQKTVLGKTANLDLFGFSDVVLARDASAPFVLGRLWNQLVSDSPPDSATTAAMVAAYGPGRNIGAAVSAMLTSPGLTAATGSRVVSPVEWTIGLARAVGVSPKQHKAITTLVDTMTGLGQQPFAPPSVGGWPSGHAWLSTAAAMTRIRAAETIVAAGSSTHVQDASPADRIDAVAYVLGIATWSDRTRAALQSVGSDPASLLVAGATSPEYLTI